MIELTIPQPGEETKRCKDLVFSILSEQQPLTTKKLHNVIKKQYNVNVTYQAVKKAIDTLLEQDVLLKEDKQYQINKDWLVQIKQNIDDLLRTYEQTKTPDTYKEQLAKEEYAVYTFTTLLELDNFWDDMLLHIRDNLNNEPYEFYAKHHYTWFLLINLGRETDLFEHLHDKNIETYLIFLTDDPLNEWSKQLYTEQGTHCTTIEPDTDEPVSVNILGNTVIQVHYPQAIMNKLQEFYQTYDTIQDMSYKEITELVHEPCEITMNVFTNEEIATNMRRQYQHHFQ